MGAMIGIAVDIFYLFADLMLPGGSPPNGFQIIVGILSAIAVWISAFPWMAMKGFPEHLVPWMVILDWIAVGALFGLAFGSTKEKK